MELATVKTKETYVLAVNFDGVLLGSHIDLLSFNQFLVKKFYFNEKITLVYLTGRSLSGVLNEQFILLPDYIIAEAGSKVYRHCRGENVQQAGKQYELIFEDKFSNEQTELIIDVVGSDQSLLKK